MIVDYLKNNVFRYELLQVFRDEIISGSIDSNVFSLMDTEFPPIDFIFGIKSRHPFLQ